MGSVRNRISKITKDMFNATHEVANLYPTLTAKEKGVRVALSYPELMLSRPINETTVRDILRVNTYDEYRESLKTKSEKGKLKINVGGADEEAPKVLIHFSNGSTVEYLQDQVCFMLPEKLGTILNETPFSFHGRKTLVNFHHVQSITLINKAGDCAS